jgi:hypothetical protein
VSGVGHQGSVYRILAEYGAFVRVTEKTNAAEPFDYEL